MPPMKKICEYLENAGMPGLPAEALALLISEYGENTWRLIESRMGRIAYSYNDTYIILHRYHEFIGKRHVVEIACPYVKEQYCFITKTVAIKTISDSLLNAPEASFHTIAAPPTYRMDYKESKENW